MIERARFIVELLSLSREALEIALDIGRAFHSRRASESESVSAIRRREQAAGLARKRSGG